MLSSTSGTVAGAEGYAQCTRTHSTPAPVHPVHTLYICTDHESVLTRPKGCWRERATGGMIAFELLAPWHTRLHLFDVLSWTMPKEARAGYMHAGYMHALKDAFSLASVDRATKYLAILAVQLRSVAEPADQDGVALVQHLCDVLAAPGNQLTVFEQRGDVVRRGASAKVACRP